MDLRPVVLSLALGAVSEPALTPADQAAITKLIGAGPGRWAAVRQGRFVTEPDEWLVSAGRKAHVLRKVEGTWRRTHTMATDGPLGDQCLPLGGMADGRVRLVCLDSAGPNQGFLFARVAVVSFAGGVAATRVLMQKEQGGECSLIPPGREYQDDVVTLAPDAAGEANTAFSVRLEVRRAPCEAANSEGHGAIAKKPERFLRFVRQGDAIVPDATSARVIEEEGWAPANH